MALSPCGSSGLAPRPFILGTACINSTRRPTPAAHSLWGSGWADPTSYFQEWACEPGLVNQRGCHNWLKDRHMTKPGQMRVMTGVMLKTLGEKKDLSKLR